MPNVYARPTALSNVCGRVNYISDPKRQENLVAVYSEVDQQFWKDLSKHCQKQAAEAGHKKACEGREWHGAIPNIYAEIYRGREKELAKEISDILKEITGTDNIVALHWNKSMTNFHFHGVCSENKEINEVTYGAVLTRNTYYDAAGKRSTKKECLDSDGNLLHGCRFYPKGSRVETVCRFGTKEDLRHYTVNEAIKKALAEKFNQDLSTEQFQVYKNDGIHLKTQKVGKYIPEDIKEQIEQKNAYVKEYNRAADELLEIAAQVDQVQVDEVTEALKKCRNNIKNERNTDRWLKAINHYLGYIRKQIEGLRAFLKRKNSREGLDVDRKIISAEQEKNREKKEHSGKQKKPASSGDDWGNK